MDEATFNSYIVELLAFRAKHGNEAIPKKDSDQPLHKLTESQLAVWVAGVNKCRKTPDLTGSGPSGPTRAQVEILTQAGFPWERSWEDCFEKLVAYRREHGHSNVVRRGSSLGSWVCDQRKAYKRRMEGKGSSMTRERIALLESVDFKWRLKESKDVSWLSCYHRLAAYREVHSHCNVPRKYATDQSLANWVAKQRHHYKKRKSENNPRYISDEQIGKLNEIGFKWFVNNTKSV